MRIIIIGAGPIGCYTAQLLKKNAIDPLLIEEHEEIGRPVHCAGVVGRELFKNSKIGLSKNCIKTEIDGAEIFYAKESFMLKRKAVACVLDREAFDKDLGKGLNVKYQTKFLGFEKAKTGYIIETDKGDLQADIIIGADGATSRVRDAAGLNNGVRYFSGVQFRIGTGDRQEKIVRVYIKKPFFSWIVPESDGIVRAGIISENPYSDLNKFLQEIGLHGDVLDKFGGIIPVGSCRIISDNVALVGDAACQVKPLTHGGLFYGMRAAEVLADCIIKKKLKEYDGIWNKKYGNEIRMSLYFKGMYERLNDEDIGILFEIMRISARKIEKIADFENHSRVIVELLKDKQVQGKLSSVLWNMLKRKGGFI